MKAELQIILISTCRTSLNANNISKKYKPHSDDQMNYRIIKDIMTQST